MNRSAVWGTVLMVCGWAATAVGEVHLHRDMRGVRIRVGNVVLNTRPGGRVTSTFVTGRTAIHGSNYGLSGVSYAAEGGRLDVFRFNRPHTHRPRVWYQPYSTYAPYDPVGRTVRMAAPRPAWSPAGSSTPSATSTHRATLLPPPRQIQWRLPPK